MPSFFKLLKEEFIALLRFPTTKDSNEIRFQKRVVRFPAPVNEKRRSLKTVARKSQALEDPVRAPAPRNSTTRPRSYSAPSNVKIEQRHISRKSQSTPQNKLSQKVLQRKTTSVNVARNDRSSTVVQIEV